MTLPYLCKVVIVTSYLALVGKRRQSTGDAMERFRLSTPPKKSPDRMHGGFLVKFKMGLANQKVGETRMLKRSRPHTS